MWGCRAAGLPPGSMRLVAAVLLVAVLLAGAAGCSTVVAGSGSAAPDAMPSAAVPSTALPADPSPDTPAPTRSALAADVLADECLLDALQFSALLGRPVLPPEQGEVQRADGSSSSSCVAESARGFPDPLAAVNVYEPRAGTPADFVRAGPPQGRRELPGVGEAAVLVDTAPGVTLQLAGARYVVTISVLDGAPSDDDWRAAATAALAALPA